MTPHIFTLTGNLLAERTLDFEQWKPGATQRAKRETFQVGGKGINVSKMLNRLGAANTTLCFAGGAPGAECEAWLRGHGFNFRAFATDAPTRSGTVVRDATGTHAETTFLGPDVAPSRDAVRACAEFLESQADGHILALCGSAPGWAGADFDPLRAAINRWLERGIVVADTYGPPLAWLIMRPLDLIKLNATELRAAGFGPRDPLPLNVLRWVVTDGPRPVRIRASSAAETSLVPPHVREISATGSGDVLFACVLHALYHRRMALPDAVAFALPYAAANAAHAEIAEFPEPL
jgi:fructose-1-phosphate kinase PfkB-like protein